MASPNQKPPGNLVPTPGPPTSQPSTVPSATTAATTALAVMPTAPQQQRPTGMQVRPPTLAIGTSTGIPSPGRGTPGAHITPRGPAVGGGLSSPLPQPSGVPQSFGQVGRGMGPQARGARPAGRQQPNKPMPMSKPLGGLPGMPGQQGMHTIPGQMRAPISAAQRPIVGQYRPGIGQTGGIGPPGQPQNSGTSGPQGIVPSISPTGAQPMASPTAGQQAFAQTAGGQRLPTGQTAVTTGVPTVPATQSMGMAQGTVPPQSSGMGMALMMQSRAPGGAMPLRHPGITAAPGGVAAAAMGSQPMGVPAVSSPHMPGQQQQQPGLAQQQTGQVRFNTGGGQVSMPGGMTGMTGTAMQGSQMGLTQNQLQMQRQQLPQQRMGQMQQQNQQRPMMQMGPMSAGAPRAPMQQMPNLRPPMVGVSGAAVSQPAAGSPSGAPRPGHPQQSPTANGAAMPTQILSKRSLQDLLSQVDPGGREKLDTDVEELLLTMADDFVESMVTFSAQLAKHRKSTTLEAKDVSLHLEHNHHISIPGFGGDEYRQYKRSPVSEPHKKRVETVRRSIAVAMSNPLAPGTSNLGQSAGAGAMQGAGAPSRLGPTQTSAPNKSFTHPV